MQVCIDGFRIHTEPTGRIVQNHFQGRSFVSATTVIGSLVLPGIGKIALGCNTEGRGLEEPLSGMAALIALTPDETERLQALAGDIAKRIEVTVSQVLMTDLTGGKSLSAQRPVLPTEMNPNT